MSKVMSSTTARCVPVADNVARCGLVKLVATYPIGKGEFAFGSEYTHTKSEGFNVNEPNLVSDSQTLLYESNVAGFASFNIPFGHYQLNTGLRYEHVKTDYYNRGVWESEPSRTYDNVFPNISLSWNKDLWSWQLSYAMKTKRPSYRNLRNYMQYDSRYLYEGGNPYLRPGKISTTWSCRVCING